MRELTDHKIGAANEQLKIIVTDEPGAGGANHRYEVTGFNSAKNPSAVNDDDNGQLSKLTIVFQNGPIKESGVNGVTQEALLAIVIDRLKSFQAGPHSCRDNAVALTHIDTALLWLQRRTRERMERGVEGTSQK